MGYGRRCPPPPENHLRRNARLRRSRSAKLFTPVQFRTWPPVLSQGQLFQVNIKSTKASRRLSSSHLGSPCVGLWLGDEKKLAEWARFRRCRDDFFVNIARPIKNIIARGDGEQKRTRGATDANGIELHHELGHRLPGRLAVPVRSKTEDAIAAAPQGRQTNGRARPLKGTSSIATKMKRRLAGLVGRRHSPCATRPLSGAKRKFDLRAVRSAFDPKRTSVDLDQHERRETPFFWRPCRGSRFQIPG
jgi:hypothetical protein